MKNFSVHTTLAFCLIGLASIAASSATPALPQTNVLNVSVSRAKAERGERVEIVVIGSSRPIKALLLIPHEGSRDLEVRRSGDGWQAIFHIPANSPSGLYVVHAWIGDRAKPSFVGKASFRVGNI